MTLEVWLTRWSEGSGVAGWTRRVLFDIVNWLGGSRNWKSHTIWHNSFRATAALKTTCTQERQSRPRSADGIQVRRAVSNTPFSPTRRSETPRRKFRVPWKTHRGRYTETRDFSLLSRPFLGDYTLARLCWITMVKGVLEDKRIKRGGRRNEEWRLQREEVERQLEPGEDDDGVTERPINCVYLLGAEQWF